MKTTVTGIVKSFTNTNRFPVVTVESSSFVR